ncbi:MAG TPA: cell division protein ZapE [Steroidobacteraceae bacterium]|nr:cell division protein ZapE [Steroidobacteraceae bacterium]
MNLPETFRREFAHRGYTADTAQVAASAKLEDLRDRLRRAERRERRWLWRVRAALGRVPRRRPVPGAYLWGSVGRGKTLLLDTFFASLEVPARRVHFHRFMREVHARLRQLRDSGLQDPLARIAADIATEVRVLCFDELYVSDIADAMLLGGLIAGLVERGVTLVLTSNVPPSELYRDGLQRSRFLPAITLLERNTTLIAVDAGTDYRLRQLERAPLYLSCAAEDADARLLQRFEAIAGSAGVVADSIEIEERAIAVRRRAGGAVWFAFAELCEGPRSVADYIEIARQYHTVVVSDIPEFDAARDDAARRFIALVDEFYERAVKLVVSAAAAPEQLYHGERLAPDFRRTASRLAEMQSREYLARPHRP